MRMNLSILQKSLRSLVSAVIIFGCSLVATDTFANSRTRPVVNGAHHDNPNNAFLGGHSCPSDADYVRDTNGRYIGCLGDLPPEPVTAPQPLEAPQPPAGEVPAGNAAPVGTVVREELPPISPATVPAAGGQSPSTDEDGKRLTTNCQSAATTAKAACNVMGFAGMAPEQGAMMEMMMSQALNIVGQINSSGGAADTCKKQADLSKIMAMISAAKGAACGGAMAWCSNACNFAESESATTERTRLADLERRFGIAAGQAGALTEPERTTEIEDLRKLRRHMGREKTLCSRYTQNMMMALMQGMQFGAAMLQNNQCAAAASVTPYPIPPGMTPLPPPDTPVMPTPADCSDPAVASTSLVCLCQNDPTNKICGQSTPPPIGGGSPGGGGPQTPGRPFSSNTPERTAGDAVDSSSIGAKPSSGSNTTEGGGGGFGGGSGGGGGGFGSEGGGEGPPRSNIDKNVITGASSGGGGLYSGGGGGGGTGSRGGGAGSGGGGAGAGFNLKKFLPKSDYKNRGLSGMTLPSTDGVTGPMGPSIWEKVTNQYQLQKPKLLNDR